MDNETDSKFYNSDELYNKKDINHQIPSIRIVCSLGRSVGKTTDIGHRRMLEPYFTKGEKFAIIVRHKNELGQVGKGMFSVINSLFYDDKYVINETVMMKGVYSKLEFISGSDENKTVDHVGWVIPLTSAKNVKLLSSYFGNEVVRIWFDEFMPEDSKDYLKYEVESFLSIVKSLSRGGGDAVRDIEIWMSSNCCSIFSPYFVEMGLHKRIKPETKWVKGDGFVFQRTESKAIAEEHAKSAINRAFSHNKTIQYNKDDGAWMNDSFVGIENPDSSYGRPDYFATLIANETKFAVRYYPLIDMYYVNYTIDKTYTSVFNIIKTNLEPNVPLLRDNIYIDVLRRAVRNGNIRFKDFKCKQMCMDLFV